MSTINKFITGILAVSLLISLVSAWGSEPLNIDMEQICFEDKISTACDEAKTEALSSKIKGYIISFLLLCVTIIQVIYAQYKYALELKQDGVSNSLTGMADKFTKSIDDVIYMMSTNRPFAPQEINFDKASRYHIKPENEVTEFFKHQYFYKRVMKDGQDMLVRVDAI